MDSLSVSVSVSPAVSLTLSDVHCYNAIQEMVPDDRQTVALPSYILAHERSKSISESWYLGIGGNRHRMNIILFRFELEADRIMNPV